MPQQAESSDKYGVLKDNTIAVETGTFKEVCLVGNPKVKIMILR
jgi:hypothetical protein